ncbi:MAG: phosphate acyltransferase PlsX [Pseudomonadota bacterium]
MTEAPTLSIDAMGGDAGPRPVLDGIVRFLRTREDTRLLLHGNEEVLTPLVRRRRALDGSVEICHAPDTVSMSDQPSQTLRTGRNSSMWHALKAVADGRARAAVSAGNTGALMAMSVLILRKAPGVDRPAIAVHWPSNHASGFTTVLDVGADLRADPHNLSQYAVMGAEYARASLDVETPRVGLLNIGTEATKGHSDLHDASDIISAAAERPESGFRFLGFVEGTHIPTGEADVIVTDGFTGNIALKTGEATARFISNALKAAFKHTPLSRIGYLFALTSLNRMRKRIDPRRVNGGVFLGLNGPVVKSHGGADGLSFSAALHLAAGLARNDFSGRLASQLANLGLDRKTATGVHGAERQAR